MNGIFKKTLLEKRIGVFFYSTILFFLFFVGIDFYWQFGSNTLREKGWTTSLSQTYIMEEEGKLFLDSQMSLEGERLNLKEFTHIVSPPKALFDRGEFNFAIDKNSFLIVLIDDLGAGRFSGVFFSRHPLYQSALIEIGKSGKIKQIGKIKFDEAKASPTHFEVQLHLEKIQVKVDQKLIGEIESKKSQLALKLIPGLKKSRDRSDRILFKR
jgi:hypothetical protein